MRMSQLYAPTLREVPAEAEIVSHQLLLRAGLVRRISAGIYTYLPLGYRTLRKIMDIIREEMDKTGAQELMLPVIQPAELWHETGRWFDYGDEMMKVVDRHGRYFALGPTHEEVITDLVRSEINSYRQLPVVMYQIQNKYRDEIRPRFGLLRGREFVMKDAYSFDRDYDGLDCSYRTMYEAYQRIFARCGLDARPVEADSGAIGGTDTHEFMVICDDVGEADIAHCDNCGYAANVEKAISAFTPGPKVVVEEGSPRVVDTPEKRTITEVADFLSVPVTHLIKALVYIAGDRPVMAVVRGDHEVNEVKLARHLEVLEVELADSSVVEQVTGAPVGFGGPINLPEEIPVIVDREVMELRDAVCGANSLDQHYVGVEPWRDFPQVEVADIRMVTAGDPCPKCNAPLSVAPGIEVGQVFKLGTKYSQAMNATYLDESGKEQPLVMGCYGIGVSRTLAAVIEKHHDDDGIIWPVSIAPYHVIVVPVNWKDAEQKTTAEELYQRMQELGIEVILDDRDERPGVKFKDADLIGIPIRIVVGRSVKDGKVEFKLRWEEKAELVELSAVIDKVSEIVHTAR
ncbi:MAG: proline--tRNA ligase [Firmicutes bacterium]|nr:proline--tRNA ligase [Bacillota bacterium]